ncbi:MazG nucleotide pyrophosphohydrolase domain-containing protein [Promethearchaeum syntrophicum]|uniref:MazG nucleotide pyrophosphohydrolase domain-containing protein n=1 Tax=Promethearchaeum syntrophicum TaxID=2594042 RepID=A0A5B9D742_9ARCH|nr:MazG nucleotide pyrophosphohydrolase domain-containing protein [Candidatus Prometheoarchaeum syntrophicum]QEE14825.1 MazG nucleotide pyrophosphohydrolase domain protein [Candidatus Prometheoarchaeum syntrophicum]
MKEFTIKEIQELVDDLIQTMNGYWPPLAMLASVTEELGELAREINALEKIKIKKSSEIKKNIGEELADLLFSIICISNFYKIDINSEFKQVMEKYQKRDKNRFLN